MKLRVNPGLKEIGIINFQNHQETEMVFDPGFNVIVGDTEAGKSSIEKALVWLFTNRPSGDDFKNCDVPLKDPVAVECVVDNNRVSINRESDKTSYVINGGKPLSAIKLDVPQEVLDLLNISDVNIQGQHDPYFLIKDTPGVRAQKLNELVGLDVIDVLYKNLGSKIRELNSNINDLKGRITNTEEELKTYENLPEIEKLVVSIEKKHAETSALDATRTYIVEKLSQLEQIKIDQEKLAPLINSEADILNLMGKIEKHETLKENKSKTQILLSSLDKIKEDMEIDRGWLELEKPIQSILDKIEKHDSLKTRREDIQKMATDLATCQSSKDKMDKKLRLLIEKYVDLIKQAGSCPTCGTKLEEEGLNEVQNFLVKT